MKKILFPLVILLGVCLLFFWPIFKGFMPFPGDLLIDSNPYRSLSFQGYSGGSYPNKAQGMDVITEMYPWRFFTISEFKQGRIPFWNPHNFSGNIHEQNFQSSVFNPFNLIFFILPFQNAWTLFILIQPILASFFFYLFARELKLSRFAALVGGIGFAFSQYMTVWIEYGNIAATLAYLPLLLYFLLKFFKKPTKWVYAGFIASAFLMLLSGYIQGAFYSYCVAIAFTIALLVKAGKTKWNAKTILTLFALFIFPVFLTSFQTLSTVQVFSVSSRWPYNIKQFQEMLQPIWYWITLFASDFFGNPATRNYYLSITYIERVAYIGIPLFIFAILALSRKRPFVFFFLGIGVTVFLLTTNIPGISYFYLLPIPVINTTVPTRLLSIFMFAAVVLATFGIDAFFAKRNFPKKLTVFFVLFYALLWAGVSVAKHFYPQFSTQISISQHNLVIPTLFVIGTLTVFLIAKKQQNVAKMLLFGIVVIDLFYSFHKITPFAPKATVYPVHPVVSYLQKNAGINRFWGYGSGYILPNFQTVDGTYSPEGNDPLHMKYYGELLTSSFDGKLPILPPRPDANLAHGFGDNGMKNPYRQKLLNLLGIKYILQHDETRRDNEPDNATFAPENYTLVWSQNPWQIYENKNVLPRYFLVNHVTVATGQKALDALYTSDLSNTVIISKPLTVSLNPAATGSVQLNNYLPQKITFTTQTSDKMVLFLSDTYFPSWRATIDGHETPIFLADYAFRGIVVPQGKHNVAMYYYPQYFIIGLVVSLVTLVFFAVSFFFI